MTTLKSLSELDPEHPFWQWVSDPLMEMMLDAILDSLQPPVGSASIMNDPQLRSYAAKAEAIKQIRDLPKHPVDLRALLSPKAQDDVANDHGL